MNEFSSAAGLIGTLHLFLQKQIRHIFDCTIYTNQWIRLLNDHDQPVH